MPMKCTGISKICTRNILEKDRLLKKELWSPRINNSMLSKVISKVVELVYEVIFKKINIECLWYFYFACWPVDLSNLMKPHQQLYQLFRLKRRSKK